MQSTAAQPSLLTDLLTAARKSAEDLLEALREENHALRTNDIAGIEQASLLKSSLIDALDAAVAKQMRLLSQTQPPADGHGMSQYLDTLPREAKERTLWSDLLKLIAKCNEQNEINGGVVLLSRRHVKQALDIINGAPDNGRLYDRSGEHLSVNKTTTLAKA